MRFGVCFAISEAAAVQAIGFDYLEVHAGNLAAMTEEEFEIIKTHASKGGDI